MAAAARVLRWTGARNCLHFRFGEPQGCTVCGRCTLIRNTSMSLSRLRPWSLVAALAALSPLAARADVTVQQKATFDLAIIKANSSSTEYTTLDKQRRDSDFHCEGFMSMFCGNQAGGQIIRLDKDVEYTLEPKKKEYLERRFPTAAEREAFAAKMRANLDKLKSCPAAQQQTAAPDTSKCEMSPPKFDVKQT